MEPNLGKCPMCGNDDEFITRPYSICEKCGWERDPLQELEPDFSGGANRLSLNEAKKEWKEGRTVW